MNLALTWPQAAVLGADLLSLGVGCQHSVRRRAATIGPFIRESGIVALLYALWQLAGTASFFSSDGAVARGWWIVRIQRDWHLPDELRVQHLVTPHPLLAQACNLYYATMHFTGLFAMLLWLFVRHRDRYPYVRNTIVLLTASCLVISFLPVAPPRLLPGAGYMDTAEQYGQSVYAALQAVGPDQLSAMPSVHVGWAVLVGLSVVSISSSRWRWWALLHPALTIFVVVATANHYWLDGIVAVALLVLSLLAQRGGRALRRRVRRTAPAATPEPAPELLAARD